MANLGSLLVTVDDIVAEYFQNLRAGAVLPEVAVQLVCEFQRSCPVSIVLAK